MVATSDAVSSCSSVLVNINVVHPTSLSNHTVGLTGWMYLPLVFPPACSRSQHAQIQSSSPSCSMVDFSIRIWNHTNMLSSHKIDTSMFYSSALLALIDTTWITATNTIF